jgi:UDP-N-acetylglucosamine 2-epimerase (non-hydrolysing)
MKIFLVAGARPNFMKIASIVDAIRVHNRSAHRSIDYLVVHTGQHYDEQMSDVFFKDLALPPPDIALKVGSSSHASQTAEIMKTFEPVLLKERPDVVVVVGDVNSTVACSLVASKVTYPPSSQPFHRSRPLVAHVEAGLRSFDRSMPEETNRIVTDAIADFLFITEKSGEDNLLREGVAKEKIHFVGNTMVDTLLKHRRKAEESNILFRMGFKRDREREHVDSYAVVTLHRPSNVDNRESLHEILDALTVIAKEIPILFPVHPRTLKRIEEFRLASNFDLGAPSPNGELRGSRIRCLEPLGYLDFLCLMSNAKLVLTDSGGIQEETTVLGVPCVTLRQNTERPITLSHGTNVLAGMRKEDIIRCAFSQLSHPSKPKQPPLWDGGAGERIVKVLSQAIDDYK